MTPRPARLSTALCAAALGMSACIGGGADEGTRSRPGDPVARPGSVLAEPSPTTTLTAPPKGGQPPRPESLVKLPVGDAPMRHHPAIARRIAAARHRRTEPVARIRRLSSRDEGRAASCVSCPALTLVACTGSPDPAEPDFDGSSTTQTEGTGATTQPATEPRATAGGFDVGYCPSQQSISGNTEVPRPVRRRAARAYPRSPRQAARRIQTSRGWGQWLSGGSLIAPAVMGTKYLRYMFTVVDESTAVAIGEITVRRVGHGAYAATVVSACSPERLTPRVAPHGG